MIMGGDELFIFVQVTGTGLSKHDSEYVVPTVRNSGLHADTCRVPDLRTSVRIPSAEIRLTRSP